MMDKRVLIGMSGGVDSSTAAYLACQEGYCCTGATMELVSGGADAADARSVAQRLGMEHVVLPFQQAFSQQVIQPFVDSYEKGLTPNPCIRCNQALKFGVLLDWALEQGYDYVASGHYARLRRDENTGRYLLYQAADPAKDQTYFLAGLNQRQLSHILFPLGELTKQQVRQIAESQGFVNARKRDSQDICFIPDGDYAAFLERFTGKTYPQGTYLDLQGQPLGQHQGAVRYTIGQRKGLPTETTRLSLSGLPGKPIPREPTWICRASLWASTRERCATPSASARGLASPWGSPCTSAARI